MTRGSEQRLDTGHHGDGCDFGGIRSGGARRNTILLSAVLVLILAASALGQQTGTIRGQVTDESGALIPGASITVTGENGFSRTLATDEKGSYLVTGLPAGRYTLRANSTGFATYEKPNIDLSTGRTLTLNVPMRLSLGKQEVTVQGEGGATVSTEATNNAGQLVLKGADLDALPDDPDDLAADLQALAGPSAGPNGGQIFIDGFTGGRLPPKESIREIRINQNPFSAEYDRLGFGRIEILTKPGTDKYRGQTFFEFSDGIWNSRNPYANNKPPFQARQYGGNLSGPINKRSSFFFDFERREIDDNVVINATVLDPSSLLPSPFAEAVLAPQRRTTLSPRFDYQLNANHTLVGRYTFTRVDQNGAGIGQFSLPSRAYTTLNNENSVQMTETAVLGGRAVNETRFQYIRQHLNLTGDNSIPTINVLESFTGGGAQVGRSFNIHNRYELQNYTSIAKGPHSLKFGVRIRTATLDDSSPQNFGGTFTFAGGFAPQLDANNQIVVDTGGQPALQQIDSLERYRRTLLFQKQGLSPDDIRRLGGGASQFSIAGGNPLASIAQTDVGVFLQDDWRVKQNFTLSAGLRYETQTNIHDRTDFAPRIGFAWAPGGKSGRQAKTVIRGGYGMFYDRFSENLGLQAIRYNGVNQQQFIVGNPDFFPNIPAIGTLDARAQTLHRVDQNLRAPYIMQSAIGIERQLPHSTTFATTFTNSHAIHLLRSRDINAPLPGTNVRPFGSENIYQFESTGVLNQNQWISNVRTNFRRNLSIFAYYVLNYAHSNTDGAGTFPANQYDLSGEYGRSALDTRHRFVLGGSLIAPWAVRLSPFVIVHSGSPYNITIGRDLNGDTVFTDRPAFATDLAKRGVVVTRFGAFDPSPAPGEAIIPRNFGNGPSFLTVNLRLSRTWGFGPMKAGFRGQGSDMGGGDHGPRGGGGGGPRGGDHGPGGMRMGGGGFHGMGGGEGGSTEHRYNLTFSASARNLFNTLNPGTPIGNLSSPYFGTSNAIAGGFGPVAMANNRRLELQLRFSF